MLKEPLIDYRDRASVLVWVVLFGLAAQRLLALPTVVMTGLVLGSPIEITITTNTIVGIILAGLVITGTEAVVRSHPLSHSGDLRAHWLYWGVPLALIGVAVWLLPLAPSRLYWMVGLTLTGVALGLSLAGIYHTMDPFERGYRRARIGLNALTYGIALMLYLVVYGTRVRSIVSGTETLVASALLALELLRGSQRPSFQVALYAGITGLLLGQATWALNYMRLPSLTGGLVLLLLFYNIVGLSQHSLQGHVSRRVALEFGLITLAALALIWEFAP